MLMRQLTRWIYLKVNLLVFKLTELFRVCFHVLKRDLILSFTQKFDWLNPLFFLVLFTSLIPLSMDPSPENLSKVAPSSIWTAALLSSLLSLETLFKRDFEDGTLEQLYLIPYPTSLLIFMKIFAHWLSSGLPITLLSIPLALMLFMPADGIITLFYTLLIGTPILSLIGAIGAALALNLQRGGLLLALLLLPLYIPVLILGAGSVYAAVSGLAISGQLALLAAMLIGCLLTTPLMTMASIRISLT